MVSHYDPIRVIFSKRLGLDNELSSWGVVIPNAGASIIVRNENGHNNVTAIGIPPIGGLLRKSLQIKAVASAYNVR